jgi:FlaA1/EpsC-like NDP-sugar epimerase
MSMQNAWESIVRRSVDSLWGVPSLTVRKYSSNLAQFVLAYRSWFIALLQALLVFCSLVLAWLLRFDFSLPDRLILFSAAPILIVIRLAAIARFGLLHGWWKYTGVDDAVAIFKAIAVGSVAFRFFIRFGLGVVAFPQSVYILEAVLSLALLIGIRVVFRVLAESFRKGTSQHRNILLIGAGFGAQMVIREIERPGSIFCAIGCVDDDRSKMGMRLNGVPVIGAVNELPRLVKMHTVDEVLIAVPSATGKQMQRFVELCKQAEVRFKTVPALQDIITGQVSISQFRDVRLEDLLGRDPVDIDLQSVTKQIQGQVVLVTGAAGSIGSEICRQVLEHGPAKLLCLDQSETGTFYLQLELSQHKNGSQLVFCIADVGDCERMRRIFAEHEPQIVFHAAAYKHVPMMEKNVHEAVKNNVFALLSLLEIAEENGCSNFVLISSDKAVRPTSVMGATKRLGELIISCRPTNSMRCVSVRFGNVLGSNGSVLPVFQQQLRDNQPLTVTHPEIKRFFMTTREAVSLVLEGLAIGNHGDTLLLDMGKPIRILDLARTLIRLSGKSEQEVGIKFTGLREGEKLFEELFYPTEEIHPTSFQKITRIHGTPSRWFELQTHLDELRASLSINGAAPVRAKIKEIVPEYSYRLCDQQEESAVRIAPTAHAAPEAFQKATSVG